MQIQDSFLYPPPKSPEGFIRIHQTAIYHTITLYWKAVFRLAFFANLKGTETLENCNKFDRPQHIPLTEDSF